MRQAKEVTHPSLAAWLVTVPMMIAQSAEIRILSLGGLKSIQLRDGCEALTGDVLQAVG